MTGYRPGAAGRNTSARKTTPSRIGTGTSFSTTTVGFPIVFPPCLALLSFRVVRTEPGSLLRHVATINWQRMPSDKGRRLRTQPHCCFGDLLRSSQTADRLRRYHLVDDLRPTAGAALEHRRIDRPRTHRIHANARLGILQGGRL